MKQVIIVVLSGLLLAGCSSSDCGKPVYRSPCTPVPELQSAAPDRCGQPVYTAPHCLPTEGIRNAIDDIHQKVFGCPAPKGE